MKQWGKTPDINPAALLIGVLVLGVGIIILAIVAPYLDGSSSSTRKYLSESTQRKIFYDMTATQDQHPYSNEWNQGVKQAAADYYNVPMSQIGEIIRQGATEGWLQPDPP